MVNPFSLQDFLLRMQSLNNIQRANQYVRNHHYSVAEHSYQATLLAMYIADAWNLKNTQKVNVEEVVRRTLLHDAAESIVSDIPYVVKIDPRVKDALDNFESEVTNTTLFKELPIEIALKYANIADKAKDSTLEGKIVAVADMLELFVHCYIEVMSGNLLQREMINNAYNWLKQNAGQVSFDLYAFIEHLMRKIDERF